MKNNYRYSLATNVILFSLKSCALFAMENQNTTEENSYRTPEKRSRDAEYAQVQTIEPTIEKTSETTIEKTSETTRKRTKKSTTPDAQAFFGEYTSEVILNDILENIPGFISDLENCVNDTSKAANASLTYNVKRLIKAKILTMEVIDETGIKKIRLALQEGKEETLKSFLNALFLEMDEYNKTADHSEDE